MQVHIGEGVIPEVQRWWGIIQLVKHWSGVSQVIIILAVELFKYIFIHFRGVIQIIVLFGDGASSRE